MIHIDIHITIELRRNILTDILDLEHNHHDHDLIQVNTIKEEKIFSVEIIHKANHHLRL